MEWFLFVLLFLISRIVNQSPTGKTKMPIKLKTCDTEKKNWAGLFKKEGPGKKGDNANKAIIKREIRSTDKFLCRMISGLTIISLQWWKRLEI